MNEIIEKLTEVTIARLRQIMKMNGDDIDEQRKAMKIVFMIFFDVGKRKNLPIMQDVAVNFIRDEYPHLKDDLDKLLLLS